MTPEKLRIKARFVHALNAIASLGEVAGQSHRFLFDFAPESIILRITEDPAPRILYCFDDTENGIVIPDLIRKIKAGDIKQEELFIGGLVATDKELIALCPEQCHAGVMQAVSKAIDKIKSELRLA
jgi:CRISPR-associated protein Cst2